jgi:chromosome segregation ATPase
MRLPVSSTLEVPHGKDPAWERLDAMEKKLDALDHRGWNADEQIEDLQLADNTLLKPVMSRIYGIEAKIREQDQWCSTLDDRCTALEGQIDTLTSALKHQVEALNLKHHQYMERIEAMENGLRLAAELGAALNDNSAELLGVVRTNSDRITNLALAPHSSPH